MFHVLPVCRVARYAGAHHMGTAHHMLELFLFRCHSQVLKRGGYITLGLEVTVFKSLGVICSCSTEEQDLAWTVCV